MTASPRPRGALWRFDRSDRWGLGLLLGLVVAGTFLYQVVRPVAAWVTGDGVSVAIVGDVVVPALDAVGTGYGQGEYDVVVADPSAWQRLADLLPGVLLTGLVAVGCWLVIAVMRDIAAGDAFRPRNVTRLRVLAVLVAVGIPTVWFVQVPVALALLTSADLGTGGPGVLIDVPWLPVLVGSVVALFAEAFKAGTGLRDDVEGLV